MAFGFGRILLTACLIVQASSQPKQTKEPSEMLVTEGGLLAIDTPRHWTRVNGPGLAFFVREGDRLENAAVVIYISSAPIGPAEDSKNLEEYIASDLVGFKKQYKKGSAQKEKSFHLPFAERDAPVYTFLSGEAQNGFEQVIYIPEAERILTLTISANTKDGYDKALDEFHRFASSYRGSIVMDRDK